VGAGTVRAGVGEVWFARPLLPAFCFLLLLGTCLLASIYFLLIHSKIDRAYCFFRAAVRDLLQPLGKLALLEESPFTLSQLLIQKIVCLMNNADYRVRRRGQAETNYAFEFRVSCQRKAVVAYPVLGFGIFGMLGNA